MKVNNVALVFRLSAEQQSDLDNLLKEQQNPASSSYHKWLTPEEYAARFGVADSDIRKVTSWLQSQGLTVEGVSRSHTEITFSGSASQVESALKTEMHHYVVKGENHFANATPAILPAAIATITLNIRNLNDFRPTPKNLNVRKVPAPHFGAGNGTFYLSPADFATIYDINATGLDGKGQTIAVVGQTGLTTNGSGAFTDIDAFRAAAGLPARTTSNFTVTTVPSTGTLVVTNGDIGEADLDLEWTEAIAKNANIIFVSADRNSNVNVWDALKYAVDNNVAPVISMSYGSCEASNGKTFALSIQQLAQEAGTQGQTIVAAAGDSGSTDCDLTGSTQATQGLAVDVPAAIPEVTGMGGSEFNGDANGNTAPYWNATTGAATAYIPETAWNDTAIALSKGGGIAAGGGGASTFFTKPSWQTGVTGIPADGQRDVPDLSLTSSLEHDGYEICVQGSCTTGYTNSGNVALAGGTSGAQPTFAGLLTLINQAGGGAGLGIINPTLYQLASAQSTAIAFHDITTGNNEVPCLSGSSPACVNGETTSFSAGAGYDQVTGLGSVDVLQLISVWPGLTSPNYTVSATPASVTITSAGQSGTAALSLSALNSFSGTVSLTCTPSSTTANISCSLNPTSAMVTGSTPTAATLTIGTQKGSGGSGGGGATFSWLMTAGGTALACIVLGVPSRRGRGATMLGVVLLG